MIDAEYEALKARVMASLDKWRPLLGLDEWELDVDFLRDGHHPTTPDCVAEVAHKWEYEGASIAVFCPAALPRNSDDLDGDMLHELAHLLVAPMSRQGATMEQQMLEELTVVRVTRALRRVRKAAAQSIENMSNASEIRRAIDGAATYHIQRAGEAFRASWPTHADVEHPSGAYAVGCRCCELEQAWSTLVCDRMMRDA